jgi:hypothetical protein
MKAQDILNIRLKNTGLSTSPFSNPEGVIANLGAYKLKIFLLLKWAVGLSMQDANEEIVESAFNMGKFLRTHVIRPTWHFVCQKTSDG